MVSIVTDFTCNVIDLRGFNVLHYSKRLAIFLARATNFLIGLCWPCWRFWSSTRWTAEWSVSTVRDFETSFWLKVFPRCQESLLALLPVLSLCLAVPELIQHSQPYYAWGPLVSFKLGLEEPPVVLCSTKVYFRLRHWCRFRANLGTGLSLTTLDAMDWGWMELEHISQDSGSPILDR